MTKNFAENYFLLSNPYLSFNIHTQLWIHIILSSGTTDAIPVQGKPYLSFAVLTHSTSTDITLIYLVVLCVINSIFGQLSVLKNVKLS